MSSVGYFINVASSGIDTVPTYWNQQITSSSQSNIYYSDGNAGIGVTVPNANMHLINNCSIGSTFATSNVPKDSLIVSSNIGIGTALPQAPLHVEGNVIVTGTILAKNMAQFRNRIINGDMNLDQRNVTITTGTGSAVSSLNSINTLDRWLLSVGASSGTLCVSQTPLNSADQLTLGGTFTNAVAIGVAPVSGLDGYYPFDSSINDASGNGNNLTATGTMQYVSGRVGTKALYLANEANVLATPTAATNYITSSYILKYPFSISFWFSLIKSPASGRYSTIFISSGTGTPSGAGNNLKVSISLSGSVLTLYIENWGVVSWATNVVTQNTWYHIGISVTRAGAMTYYFNGVQGNTYTFPTFVSTGILFGNAGIIGNEPFAGFIDDFRIYNRALSANEVTALYSVATVQVAPAMTIASGLITRLTFDNVTTDSQGVLPAPTATGTTVYSSSSKSGTASLDVTGNTIGGTMTVGLTYSLASGSFSLPLSMGFWFNVITPITSVATQTLVCIGNNAGTGTPAFQFTIPGAAGGTFYTSCSIGNITYISRSISILTANIWYYCFMTVTNSYLQLYIDGVLISSTPTGAGVLTDSVGAGSITQVRVGAQTGTSLRTPFKGYIDDVRIYNRELSPQEITGLYYSYQTSPYVLFQQPIEGLNVADLGWGTTEAQPVTVNAWIKNNTQSSQQFSLSVGNSGAAATITAITFETDSGINDTLGLLTNPIGTNVVYSTSIFKVGSRSLNLTANNAGGIATSFVSYNYNYAMFPLSVSLWIYPTAVVNWCIPFSIASQINNGNCLDIGINSSSQLYAEMYISGTNYLTSPLYTISLSPLQWIHVSVTLSTNCNMILYVNGIVVGSYLLPSTALSIAPFNLRLGCMSFGNNNYAYKGYIDDVRIYNRALIPSEIYQLYANNATSTTISQYLLPRSYLYTTPSIPSNAWQKINFTVPGDTTDSAWTKDTTPGLNLALCLGTGSAYTSSNTVGWTSTKYLTGSNIQTFGGSATNFLANANNNIYLTGVQIEKGTSVTPFELRNNAVERVMSGFNMMYQVVFNEFVTTSDITTTSLSFVDGGQPSQIIPRLSTSLIEVQFHSNRVNGNPGYLVVDLLRSINGGTYTSLTPSSLRYYSWTYKFINSSDMTLIYRDTPNTTDPVSYKVQFKSLVSANAVYLAYANMGYSWCLTEISQ